jgi:phosphoglycerate dehydrogenase-like enzyme
MKMVVFDDWERVGESIIDWPAELPDIDVTVYSDHLTAPADLIARLANADIVMLMRERTPLRADVIAALPKLRLIVTTGLRNASIDLAAAKAHGIVVSGTDSPQWGAAELAVGLIFALARRIPQSDMSMRAGRWEPYPGVQLHGSTLGIVGLGKLGSQVATVARALGMNLLAWSPNLTTERAADHGANLVSKHDLFARSDFVTIHMVSVAATRGLVGAAELRAMKPTSFLVNTSRSNLVDQEALLTALTEGWIAGAGIDVYDEEPLPAEHPLRAVPSAVLTPHIGFVTRFGFDTYFAQAAEDVRAFVAGAPVRVLNP